MDFAYAVLTDAAGNEIRPRLSTSGIDRSGTIELGPVSKTCPAYAAWFKADGTLIATDGPHNMTVQGDALVIGWPVLNPA